VHFAFHLTILSCSSIAVQLTLSYSIAAAQLLAAAAQLLPELLPQLLLSCC